MINESLKAVECFVAPEGQLLLGCIVLIKSKRPVIAVVSSCYQTTLDQRTIVPLWLENEKFLYDYPQLQSKLLTKAELFLLCGSTGFEKKILANGVPGLPGFHDFVYLASDFEVDLMPCLENIYRKILQEGFSQQKKIELVFSVIVFVLQNSKNVEKMQLADKLFLACSERTEDLLLCKAVCDLIDNLT